MIKQGTWMQIASMLLITGGIIPLLASLPCLAQAVPVNSPVLAVAFSPDGKIVASCSGAGMIRLWNVDSGKVIRAFHSDHHYSVAFSRDGRTVATGGFCKTMRIWYPDSAHKACTPENTNYSLSSMASSFSPVSKTLARERYDGTVRLFDVASGKELCTLGQSISSVAFSCDGKTLATGSNDSSIKLWNAASGQQLRTLFAHSMVTSVAFSPDAGQSLSVQTAGWKPLLATLRSSSGMWLPGIVCAHCVSRPDNSPVVIFGRRGKSTASDVRKYERFKHRPGHIIVGVMTKPLLMSLQQKCLAYFALQWQRDLVKTFSGEAFPGIELFQKFTTKVL